MYTGIVLKDHLASLGSFHDGVPEDVDPIAQFDRYRHPYVRK